MTAFLLPREAVAELAVPRELQALTVRVQAGKATPDVGTN